MGCKCSYINDNVDDYTFELYRTTIIKHKISENTKHIYFFICELNEKINPFIPA